MTKIHNQLHHQDCIEGMRALEDGCIDLAFADPPFNIGYDYDSYNDARAADEYLNWCRQWLAEIHRVLKPSGAFWLAIGDEFAADLKVIMQRELHFHPRSWVIWYYTFGVNCKFSFSRSHTHLFYMLKHPTEFTFNDDDPDIRVPSARQLVYGDKRANPAGRLPDNTWITKPPCVGLAEPAHDHQGWVLRPQDIPDSFAGHEDMWFFPRVCGTFKERAGWHGCQMPERLLGRIIRACSNEGELVLDPFGGSGTTLAVAKKLHRQFLGFEISEEYAKRIESRLASIQPGDRLDGEADPKRSAPTTDKGRRRLDQAHPELVPQQATRTKASKKTAKKNTAVVATVAASAEPLTNAAPLVEIVEEPPKSKKPDEKKPAAKKTAKKTTPIQTAERTGRSSRKTAGASEGSLLFPEMEEE